MGIIKLLTYLIFILVSDKVQNSFSDFAWIFRVFHSVDFWQIAWNMAQFDPKNRSWSQFLNTTEGLKMLKMFALENKTRILSKKIYFSFSVEHCANKLQGYRFDSQVMHELIKCILSMQRILLCIKAFTTCIIAKVSAICQNPSPSHDSCMCTASPIARDNCFSALATKFHLTS